MAAAEIDLDELSGPDVHRVLHRLRATEPVAWVPALERWLVTDRALVLEALTDPDRFTVDDPRFTTAQVVGPSMLSLDGRDHARHRGPFVPPFRRSASESELGTRITDLARGLVADLGPGPIDLRAELAAPLAAETITETLGLAGVDADEVLGWYREIVAAVDGATRGRGVGAVPAMAALSLAIAGTVDRPESLVARIAATGDLSDEELVANVAVVLFGAVETSEGMTATCLFHVLGDPAMAARLAEMPALIDGAVEESVRLEPAATLVDRYTTVDTTLGATDLPAGSAVALSLAGANRDPATFRDPDRFDPTRANVGDHLGFVRGPHACLGRHLARLETRAAVAAILTAWPGARLVDERAARPQGLVFRKPPRLVADLDPLS